VLLVSLPEQPLYSDELDTVGKVLSEKVNCHVVIDFSKVRMLTSQSLGSLLMLLRLLNGSRHQLVLCNVSSIIRRVFTRTDLEPMFEFAENTSAALQHIRGVAVSPC
jgi:anti-anti-sigma factor